MTTKSTRTAALVPRVTCIANRSTDGLPCTNRPMKGQNVCKNHGGAAPAARRKAAERILLAQDLAASKLVELMNDPNVPPHVQRSAAADLLDRGGNVAASVLAIPGLTQDEPWKVIFEHLQGGSRTESRAARGLADDTDRRVIDAELVEMGVLVSADTAEHTAPATSAAKQPESDTASNAVDEVAPTGTAQRPNVVGQRGTGELAGSPIISLQDAHPDEPRRYPEERNRARTPSMKAPRRRHE